MNDFESFWKNQLQQNLRLGMIIKHWSYHGRAKDDHFTIDSVGKDFIEIETFTKTYRYIHKSDFENIYWRWDGYNTGMSPRSQLNDNHHTTSLVSQELIE